MRSIALGDTIKTMRLSRDLSQQDLAEKIGVSRSAIGMWERGVREPNLDTIEALADVFNVPLYSLVDTNGSSDPMQEQSEPLYISVSSGNKVTDELRKLLHAMVDRLGDGDVRLLTDIAKRLQTHEPAVPFKQVGVAFNPITGQKLPAFELVCDGTAETKFAAKLEQTEMTEDKHPEQVTPV